MLVSESTSTGNPWLELNLTNTGKKKKKKKEALVKTLKWQLHLMAILNGNATFLN